MFDWLKESSPEGSFTLRLQELGCCSFKLCRRHVHRLLHLLGRRLNEVGVDMVAETLLAQHPADQVQGGAGAAHRRTIWPVVAGSWGAVEVGKGTAPVRNVSAVNMSTVRRLYVKRL